MELFDYETYRPYDKSTMTRNHLHNLALLSTEREKSEELILNPEEILNELALHKSRTLNSTL